MSNDTGARLAAFHMELTQLWRSDGPDAVFTRLEGLNPDQLRTLVMAHVGSDAATL